VNYKASSNTRSIRNLGAILAIFISIGAISLAHSQSSAATQKGPAAMHATGPFEVKLAPQDDKIDPSLGRMTFDKQFHGDLEATSKGQMLTGGTAGKDPKGSGVYVAIEKVTGTLQGKTGSFLLHHTGIMTRGEPELSINVVPDSGTDQLAGIAGKMNIIIKDGKHSYDFEYTLPEAH
jgi:hypothetical protein